MRSRTAQHVLPSLHRTREWSPVNGGLLSVQLSDTREQQLVKTRA